MTREQKIKRLRELHAGAISKVLTDPEIMRVCTNSDLDMLLNIAESAVRRVKEGV